MFSQMVDSLQGEKPYLPKEPEPLLPRLLELAPQAKRIGVQRIAADGSTKDYPSFHAAGKDVGCNIDLIRRAALHGTAVAGFNWKVKERISWPVLKALTQ